MSAEESVLTLRSIALAFALPLVALSFSCVPEDEHLPDNVLSQPDCGQHDRIDGQVRKQAVEEFTKLGKPCAEDQIQSFPQNDRETLWKVCCGPAAINFVYYTQKCVVRRSTGLLQCTK
jgi:hypothetical protein